MQRKLLETMPVFNFQMLPSHNNLLKHIPSNTIVSVHNRNIPKSNIAMEAETYRWRYLNQYPIIGSLYFGKSGKIQGDRNNNYDIMVEAKKVLLGDLFGLPIHQLLYIFKSVLGGMIKLSQKFGYFSITNRMIVINFSNQCKIWINQNLQENRVSWPHDSEKLMIEEFLQVLEKHSQVSTLSIKFFRQAYHQCSSIPKSYTYLSKFTYNQRILIPPYFEQETIQQKPKISHKRFYSTLADVKINQSNKFHENPKIPHLNINKTSLNNTKHLRSETTRNNNFIPKGLTQNSSVGNFHKYKITENIDLSNRNIVSGKKQGAFHPRIRNISDWSLSSTQKYKKEIQKIAIHNELQIPKQSQMRETSPSIRSFNQPLNLKPIKSNQFLKNYFLPKKDIMIKQKQAPEKNMFQMKKIIKQRMIKQKKAGQFLLQQQSDLVSQYYYEEQNNKQHSNSNMFNMESSDIAISIDEQSIEFN